MEYSYTVRKQVKGWWQYKSETALEKDLDRLKEVEKLLKNEDGKVIYSAAVRKLFDEKDGWSLSLEEAEPLLQSLQQAKNNRSDLKDLFNVDNYSKAARGLLRKSYEGWKDLENWDLEEGIFSSFNKDDAQGELKRLQVLVDKRDDLKAWLADENLKAWLAEPEAEESLGLLEEFFTDYNKDDAQGELKRLEGLVDKRDDLKACIADEEFLTDFNSDDAQGELERLEGLVDKRDDLKACLAEENYSKGVRRLFNERNDWRGKMDESREQYFADLDEQQVRGELTQLNEALKEATAWKKEIKANIYESLFKNVKTNNLLKAAGLDAEIETTKNMKARDMIDEEGQFKQADADTKTKRVQDLIDAVASFEDCVSQEQGDSESYTWIAKNWGPIAAHKLLDGQMDGSNVDYCFEREVLSMVEELVPADPVQIGDFVAGAP